MKFFLKGFILTLVLLVFSTTGWAANTAQQQAPYLTDIQGHWAKPAVEKVYALGLDKGFPDGTFRPTQAVQCLEAITTILNSTGYKEQVAKIKRAKNAPAGPYPVPRDQNYMDFAVQQKFIPSDLLKTFKYDRPISRGELATLLANTLYLMPPDTGKIFTDGDTMPAEYLAAAQAVNDQGLMSGYPDGSFRPQASVSRGELAAILNKLYDQGWVKVDAKRKIDGWVAGVAQGKKGLEVEVNSLKGTQKIAVSENCQVYYLGQMMDIQQIVNYRIAGILDDRRQLAFLELLERRSFSPVQRDTYGSFLRLAEGEPLMFTVKDLLCEEVDYPVAWDAVITDEKSKSKSSKDLLKKIKVDQFVKLGITSGGTIKEITLLDVKNISGDIDRIDRALYLKSSKSSSKKYVPDRFYGWDAGRLVDKDGEEISSVSENDKVKILYIGEPFYERVLEIQKLK
ncbi:S-layer homology domain-containing protein [Desulforamulus aeronauticus]|uniref:S-layer homology domain-containing protein n=1 Tax=Desulforamulus aeronauticus DSM 10349 TaxID=1121421 RepID=A0A1M6R8E5_9FIRM|nr:S-layer homology domain-containing protein [Desulforamulus aeronauticus]SHK28755.1 S-layer homology domain-containing protein [Desulforamulus aeronauticus DSM 10349]